MCVIYNSFSIPLDISFEPETLNLKSFVYFQMVIDLMYIFDIIICFRTTYIDDNGKEVFDSLLIAK